MRKTKHILGLCGLIVAADIAAYWFWSPYAAVRDLARAAKARDAEAFNARVDYPRLRASMKEEYRAMVAADLAPMAQSDSGLARAGAALGGMVGMAIVDGMVEAMVRPDMVMHAMRTRSPRLDPAPRAPDDAADNDAAREKADWALDYEGVNTVLLYADGERQPEGAAFVMRREGFADWKLTGMRLPKAAPRTDP